MVAANNTLAELPDDSIEITEKMIPDLFAKVCNKVPDLDNILNIAIKYFPASTIRLIVCVHNSCLVTNHFPESWKLMKIRF